MASNSLANILNPSGTKVNTVWIDDEWDVVDNPKAEKPVKYLEFNTPPLALVLAMQEAGKESYEIYSTLQGVGKMHGRINSEAVVTVEHQKQAAEIYDYFAKKHTMRRMKGEYISHYMLVLDDLCDTRKKIDVEHLAALLSMPRIYKQNRALENVMKGHKSAPNQNDLSFPPMEGEVTFVERLHFKVGRNNEYHYFWRTPNNYLMRIVVQKGHYGSEAWDLLAKHGKLHVSSDMTHTFNIKGYDFNVLQPSPEHMKINIA